VSNRTFQVQYASGVGQYPNNTTYYHADDLGSARLLTHWEGWRVAQPLNFRVAAPSRFFEGAEGFVFVPIVGASVDRVGTD
jgi:hypothetical protein